MTWTAMIPEWSAAADESADQLWAESGAQWLTASGVGVPDRLVHGVVGLVDFLDHGGAGLGVRLGSRGLGVLADRAAMLSMRTSSSISSGGATRLLPTLDGWIAVTLARSEDIDLISAWLGVDHDGMSYWATISDVVSGRQSSVVVDQAVLLGMPIAELGETSDSRPVLVRELGDAMPRPLNGLVVANLASLWAGPLAGDVLARLGARVIKVESTTRPDGSRRAAPFFEAMHGRCESLALDLASDVGRRQLAEFLSAVDVVIEGSRPRALAQMGIESEQLARRGPQVWISITGHGWDEPHANRVGFGDDAAVAGGLVGWVRGSPVFLSDAVADPLAGLTAAATVVQLVATGGRWLVDVALARVAASFAQSDDSFSPTGLEPTPPSSRVTRRPLPLGRDTARLCDEFVLARGRG